jgi:hypothetical protein
MKLPGVTDVKIEAGDKPSTQKVTVTSDKTGITKDEAVKSLGDKAKKFVVKTWTAPDKDA